MEHSISQSDVSTPPSVATGQTAEDLEDDVHQKDGSVGSESVQFFVTASTAAVSQLPESEQLYSTAEVSLDSREHTEMLETSSDKSDAISTDLSDDKSIADTRGRLEEGIRSESSESNQRFLEASAEALSQLPESRESEWSTAGATQLEQQILTIKQDDLKPIRMTSDDGSFESPQIQPDDESRHETSETSQISGAAFHQMTGQTPKTTEHHEQKDHVQEELVAADQLSSESALLSEHTDDGGRSSPSWMERAVAAAKDAYGSLERKLRKKKKKTATPDGDTEAESLGEDSTDSEGDSEEEEEREFTENIQSFPKDVSVMQQTPPSDDTASFLSLIHI